MGPGPDRRGGCPGRARPCGARVPTSSKRPSPPSIAEGFGEAPTGRRSSPSTLAAAAPHPSPVVALSHAAAVAMAEQLDHGLRLIEQLERAGELSAYHLLPAAKADILRRLRRRSGRRPPTSRRCAWSARKAERRYLERRLREVRSGPSAAPGRPLPLERPGSESQEPGRAGGSAARPACAREGCPAPRRISKPRPDAPSPLGHARQSVAPAVAGGHLRDRRRHPRPTSAQRPSSRAAPSTTARRGVLRGVVQRLPIRMSCRPRPGWRGTSSPRATRPEARWRRPASPPETARGRAPPRGRTGRAACAGFVARGPDDAARWPGPGRGRSVRSGGGLAQPLPSTAPRRPGSPARGCCPGRSPSRRAGRGRSGPGRALPPAGAASGALDGDGSGQDRSRQKRPHQRLPVPGAGDGELQDRNRRGQLVPSAAAGPRSGSFRRRGP